MDIKYMCIHKYVDKIIRVSHLHNIFDIWSPSGHLVSMVSFSLFAIVGMVRLSNLTSSPLKEEDKEKNKPINFLFQATNDPIENLSY